MTLRVRAIVIDSTDPNPLARWWAELLEWEVTFEESDQIVLEPPVGSPEHRVSPEILFLQVPESKQVKNRLHFDLRPDDQNAAVARAEKLGARRIEIGQDPTTT